MAVNKIVGGTGAPTIREVSGQTVSFTSKVEEPLEEVTVKINPTQNFNGYDKPWAPGGGRNLLENNFPSRSTSNFTITRNSDGTFTLNATLTGSTVIINNFALKTYTFAQNDLKKHLSNGTYFLTTNSNRGAIKIQVCASNSESSSSDIQILFNNTSGTLTIDDTYKYNWLRIIANAGTFENEVIAPVVCLSTETDTSYAPYSNICPITGWTGAEIYVSPTTSAAAGTTYNVAFPAGAGTVYGGTLDVTNGKLTVDRAEIVVTDCVSVGIASTGIPYANKNISVRAKAESSINKNISNEYRYRTNPPTDTGWFRVVIMNIYIFDSRFTNLDTANSILSSEQPHFVFELETPITIQLDPVTIRTLLGQNNIWANTGDVTVKYLKYGNTNADNIKIKLLTDIL